MCGFTASIQLHQEQSNGYTGHVNGNANVHLNRHANCHDKAPTNGINGYSNGYTTKFLESQLQASLDLIHHRGPDSSGTWITPDCGVALGHCRLSINDLSPHGHQPLHSDCEQIHAVVNGEIYDHDRIRDMCASEHGYKFHSESDSELVLALYKIYGSPGFIEHLRGEFGFVLYDEREGSEKVIAVRDRFGIKPLVYTVVGDRLLFASEAKAFLGLGWKPEWDVDAIATGEWMTGEKTLFKGVKKVLPGYLVEVTKEKGVQTRPYWDAEYEDKTKVEEHTIDEMVLGVREKLVESIRLRLRADVPVGIYLSGGIDSSAVAGIVTELSKKDHVKIGSQAASTKVACFSVQFPKESGYDESDIAERTAKWLGVETIKEEVNEAALAQNFADTAYHCEHHHFDLNCVAKFALSTLPNKHGFKVVLTGEGADEHFAGYPYFPTEFLREPDSALPSSTLSADPALRENMFTAVDTEMKSIWRNIGASDEPLPTIPALADARNSGMPETLIAWHPKTSLFAPWVRDRHAIANFDGRTVIMDSHTPEVRAKMRERWHPLHTALYMWNKSSLANVLLSCLGDRTEMAHSIEARTPFLDHHLAEYVNALPPSVKLAYTPPSADEAAKEGGEGKQGPLWNHAGLGLRSLTEKWILREAVRPYITDELYRRKKHPFLAPTKWPKNGPLHKMFVGLLTKEAVEGLGFLDYGAVESALETAFGKEGDTKAFRTLCYAGAWVTLGEKFGVKKAGEAVEWV